MAAKKFQRATREGVRLRVCLCGPAGAGKTYSAIAIGAGLGAPIAVIDSERGSASLYSDIAEYDVLELDTFSPESYMAAIRAARDEKYPVLVIDSFSHAWDGKEGMLERADSVAKRSRSGNSFNAWGEVTPLYRELIDMILSYPGHVVVTLRTKTEYVQEKDERGKTQIRKVGLAPVARAGIEYEFTLVGDVDLEHAMTISKSRAADFADKVIRKPGIEFGRALAAWAGAGGDPPSAPAVQVPAPATVPEDLAAALVAELRTATTAAELAAIVARVKPRITPAIRQDVLAVYMQLSKELPQ